jgi:hypothetical protein
VALFAKLDFMAVGNGRIGGCDAYFGCAAADAVTIRHKATLATRLAGRGFMIPSDSPTIATSRTHSMAAFVSTQVACQSLSASEGPLAGLNAKPTIKT